MTAETVSTFSDEELCIMAQEGDRVSAERLVQRYLLMVGRASKSLFLAGGDREDLIQEGLMGLLSAVREYTPEKQTSFHTFAQVCVRNKLYSAVKAANRDKHEPLNRYVSIQAPFAERGDSHTADFVLYPNRHLDPEAFFIGREEESELAGTWKGLLSGLEAKILGHYLEGLSYREIADIVCVTPKSVDNAVRRARVKLANYWR